MSTMTTVPGSIVVAVDSHVIDGTVLISGLNWVNCDQWRSRVTVRGGRMGGISPAAACSGAGRFNMSEATTTLFLISGSLGIDCDNGVKTGKGDVGGLGGGAIVGIVIAVVVVVALLIWLLVIRNKGQLKSGIGSHDAAEGT